MTPGCDAALVREGEPASVGGFVRDETPSCHPVGLVARELAEPSWQDSYDSGWSRLSSAAREGGVEQGCRLTGGSAAGRSTQGIERRRDVGNCVYLPEAASRAALSYLEGPSRTRIQLDLDARE